MRNKVLTILLVVMMTVLTMGSFAEPSVIKLKLDGRIIRTDSEPYIDDGRVMVPLRDIVEKVGARLEWNGSTRTIKVVRDKREWICQLDRTTATINGKSVKMDVAPRAIGGRTMVPIRYLCDAVGILYDWENSTKTVVMETATVLENRVAWGTKLYASKSPYIISENVVVDRNVTLAIEPGVEVVIDGDADDNFFDVWGRIKCEASTSKPVTFRARYNENPPYLKLSGGENRFENAVFHVKVQLNNSSGNVFSNCVFSPTTTGLVFLSTKNTIVENSRFVNGGFGIQGFGSSGLNIKDNNFNGVSAGAAFNTCQNISISNNKFQNGSLGVYWENMSLSSLKDNDLDHVGGPALWLRGSYSKNTVTGNNFSGNDIHVKAEITESKVSLVNNYWGSDSVTEIQSKMIGPSVKFEFQPFSKKRFSK